MVGMPTKETSHGNESRVQLLTGGARGRLGAVAGPET